MLLVRVLVAHISILIWNGHSGRSVSARCSLFATRLNLLVLALVTVTGGVLWYLVCKLGVST